MTITFPDVLSTALRSDPARPFVTFYDERSGERVELSVLTYANWVAKASGLLADEHGLERGERIRIDLPPHWLSYVFLGAAWNCGLVVTDAASDGDRPEVVVAGPDSVTAWAESGVTTLACSLLPLGARFADPLPAQAHDVGLEVWSQPDSFSPIDAPLPEDPAVHWDGRERTQGDLFDRAGSTARLLSVTNPARAAGLDSFLVPLTGGGSVVLVRHADTDRLAAIADSERVDQRIDDPEQQ